ncbi:MAG: hypothetical protein RL264_868 [Bacteroidota bacterium]|jgi:hypothetical protein
MYMKNKILLSCALLFNVLTFGQNVIVNGSFNDGLNSWSTFLADWEGVTATYSANNEEANVTGITNAGGQSWWVQLNQVLTPTQISSLVTGETYEISFQARSSVSGRPVKMFFGENGGGFAAVHMQDYTLTTTMDTYTATFLVNNTYTDMKLGFEMGLSNDDVFIDNVVLQQSATQVTTYPITFKVDMANYTGTFTTPEVNGTFNNWCGSCTPMVNTSGTIWEVTVELQAGSYEYKFSHDAWAGQENLTQGSPCTITTGAYTNRSLTVSEAATLPVVCWESCAACGTNTTKSVTFKVDLSQYTGTFTAPELNGTFNNWCGSCTPMTNAGSGIWEVTLNLPEGDYQYKFSHDNWTGQEELTPGSTCTITDGAYTNRKLTLTENVVLPVVCWGYCVDCSLVSIEENGLSSISMYPNPANEILNVSADLNVVEFSVYDNAGKAIVTKAVNATDFQIPVDQLNNGFYSVRLKTANGSVVKSFVKN